MPKIRSFFGGLSAGVFVLSNLGLVGVSIASLFVNSYKIVGNLLLFFLATFLISWMLSFVLLQ